MKPKVIYKFRDWENKFHQKILTDLEIYFAPPSSFNDPFDCNQPLDLEPIDDELTDVERLVSVVKTGIDKPEANRKDKIWLQSREIAFRRMNDDLFGIFSTALTYKNILLWSHYASNHRGFCVELDFNLLSGLYTRSGEVEYSNKISSITLEMLMNEAKNKKTFKNLFFKKSVDWKYEKEYRLLLYTDEILTSRERIIKLPHKAIKRIILGINFHQKYFQEIAVICEQREIPLVQCERVPLKFEVIVP